MYYTFTQFFGRALISFSIMLLLRTISINCDSLNVERHKEILNDLPKASDLEGYLGFMDRTIDFILQYRVIAVDANIAFGVTIVQVNVRQALMEKRQTLPYNLLLHLEKILFKCKSIIDYFYETMKKLETSKTSTPDVIDMLHVRLSHLFFNVTLWQPVEKFNVELLKRTTIYDEDHLKKIYGDWQTYAKMVPTMTNPTHEEFMKCLASLIQLPVFPSTRRSAATCLIESHCKMFMAHGNDYGYPLTHRIYFFITAKYLKNCAVFSEKEDKYKMDQFCLLMYNECQYMALHGFAFPDLMSESIVFCGLLGHAQFLTNTYMRSIAMHQSKLGCFKDGPQEYYEGTIVPGGTKDDQVRAICKIHFTSTAVGAISGVIRFIIETTY